MNLCQYDEVMANVSRTTSAHTVFYFYFIVHNYTIWNILATAAVFGANLGHYACLLGNHTFRWRHQPQPSVRLLTTTRLDDVISCSVMFVHYRRHVSMTSLAAALCSFIIDDTFQWRHQVQRSVRWSSTKRLDDAISCSVLLVHYQRRVSMTSLAAAEGP